MEARGAGSDVGQRGVGVGRVSELVIERNPDEGASGGEGVGRLDGEGSVDEVRACGCCW